MFFSFGMLKSKTTEGNQAEIQWKEASLVELRKLRADPQVKILKEPGRILLQADGLSNCE